MNGKWVDRRASWRKNLKVLVGFQNCSVQRNGTTNHCLMRLFSSYEAKMFLDISAFLIVMLLEMVWHLFLSFQSCPISRVRSLASFYTEKTFSFTFLSLHFINWKKKSKLKKVSYLFQFCEFCLTITEIFKLRSSGTEQYFLDKSHLY